MSTTWAMARMIPPWTGSANASGGTSSSEQGYDRDQPDRDDDRAQRDRRQAPGHARPDHSTGGGSERDQACGGPVDVGHDDEHRAGHQVGDAGEYVLRGVDALERLVQAQAEHGDQQDALPGTEVAAVRTGQGDEQPDERPPVVVPRPVTQPPDQPRLDDQQNAGQQDEHRHDGLERGFRQHEQEHGPGDGTQRRARTETEQPGSLPRELSTVAPGSRDATRHETHGVRHVGYDGW